MHPFDGRVVSNFIRQALHGDDITIYGDGSQTRSFCYRDDLIEGIIRMMEAPDDFTGPVNLGNPSEFTIRQLAETVLEATGARSKIVFEPLPVNDPTRRCPTSRCAAAIELAAEGPSARRARPYGRVVPLDPNGRLPSADAELLVK